MPYSLSLEDKNQLDELYYAAQYKIMVKSPLI